MSAAADVVVDPDAEEEVVEVEDGADDGGDGTDDAKDKATEDGAKDTKGLTADLGKERARRKAAETELRRLKAEGGTEAEKAIATAVSENDTKWGERFKRAAARAALAEAGVPSERLDRAVKVLDLDALEVDDEGDVDGMAGEVGALKDSFPELFTGDGKKPPPRVRTGDKGDGGGGGGAKKKTSAERLADSLMGNSA